MADSYIIISNSLKIPIAELQFKTSRSGGPGGQNVNKLETRVEVIFDVTNSPSVQNHIRERLQKYLISQLDSSGLLHVIVQDTRSQWKNKQLAIERLAEILKTALIIRKKRVATKPTKTAQEIRIRTKKIQSTKKKMRKIPIEE